MKSCSPTAKVVIRHGHTNTVTGNRFAGGIGGIRVSGPGHVVTGNTINGCRATGIRLLREDKKGNPVTAAETVCRLKSGARE